MCSLQKTSREWRHQSLDWLPHARTHAHTVSSLGVRRCCQLFLGGQDSSRSLISDEHTLSVDVYFRKTDLKDEDIEAQNTHSQNTHTHVLLWEHLDLPVKRCLTHTEIMRERDTHTKAFIHICWKPWHLQLDDEEYTEHTKQLDLKDQNNKTTSWNWICERLKSGFAREHEHCPSQYFTAEKL